MPLFTPDIALSGAQDEAGFGLWLGGHYYEHKQFITLGLQATPTKFFIEYDLYSWDNSNQDLQRVWLEQHAEMHDALRIATGVDGIDLSEVNWQDAQAVQDWMRYHAVEHGLLRTAFGVT